jgi:ribose 5-phosphate isomerase A
MTNTHEISKRAAGEAALQYVRDGDLVGLGTGSTVKYFLLALGEKVKSGFRVQGIPSSLETARIAHGLHIPLLPYEGEWELDVAVDGADQVDSHFQLIKGGGGALLREKIVASAARQFIVVVDETKCVPVLGKTMPVPVEVIPFGWPNAQRQIRALGWSSRLRQKNNHVFKTDEGNFILDVEVGQIENPATLENRLNSIPGVAENGLFVDRTSLVIIGGTEGVEIRERSIM